MLCVFVRESERESAQGKGGVRMCYRLFGYVQVSLDICRSLWISRVALDMHRCLLVYVGILYIMCNREFDSHHVPTITNTLSHTHTHTPHTHTHTCKVCLLVA